MQSELGHQMYQPISCTSSLPRLEDRDVSWRAVLPLATLILLGATAPLRAQYDWSGVALNVCNKGTIPVEAVAAERNDPILGIGKLYWNITSKRVAPGKCEFVFGSTFGLPAYIAFGYDDANGQWGSGTIAHVPDFGSFPRNFHSNKILIGAARAMCTRKNEYGYSIDGDLSSDCARLNSSNAPDAKHGPFVPLTAALYFETVNQRCYDGGVLSFCERYLNISPNPSERELHAAEGLPNGQDLMAHRDDSAAIRFWQAVVKAAADERERKARFAADSVAERKREAADTVGAGQRRLVERAAAREQQQKAILAADAAGDPNVKVEAQMIRREDENNRQRWAGTRQSPAAYDPQWMGQNMVIVGTVSRVDVDPNGSPQWVSIYFKESPDATVVVCSPYPDLFQERIGQDLSALVGKTMEAAGQVESPYCGKKTVSKASIRVVESKQWQVH
jgi:hypothetical protein